MKEKTVGLYVRSLLAYGRKQGLLCGADEIYARNRLLDCLHCSDYEDAETGEALFPAGEPAEEALPEILSGLCDYAAEQGFLPEDTVTQRDLFDTRLMDCLMPRPGEVIRQFEALCAGNPEEATDYFYRLSQDSNYIRRDRIRKDLKWKTQTPYGALDITINLSKPEKDPRDIAAAKKMKQSGYPKCLLCVDNEGYAGRTDYPARENHRIIPLSLCGEEWGFQYSPYVYYREHCIVLNRKHTPMKISEDTFRKLFAFVRRFPHYMLGSNADLPIVGGSILTHDHFQGGRYEFPMAKAETELSLCVPERYLGVQAVIVKWPMPVLRLSGKDPDAICTLAGEILVAWRAYTDEAAMVFAETGGEPHNTITPIARIRNGVYELDLVLRNNLTTKEHPLGLYHPHAKLHHIKKENIGLIEVMGLAVLPARLRTEMQALLALLLRLRGEKTADADFLSAVSAALLQNETLAKHAAWVMEWLPGLSREAFSETELWAVLENEIGKVFCEVLEDAGVYRCDKEGRAAFLRFLKTVGLERNGGTRNENEKPKS